jgi:hypothetical protein
VHDRRRAAGEAFVPCSPALLVLALWGGAATSAACTRHQPDATALASAPLLDRPFSEWPAEMKESDLRLAPPRVRGVAARAAPDGRTILEVAFAPDPRLRLRPTLEIGSDTRKALLHDDGKAEDRTAGDGVFSLIRDVSFDLLRSEQARLLKDAAELGVESFRTFDGRHVDGTISISKVMRDGLPAGSGALGGARTHAHVLLHALPDFVATERSLLIRDLDVVEDRARANLPCTDPGGSLGPWTFGHLMTEMASPEEGAAAALTEDFLAQLAAATPVEGNHLPATARLIARRILATWPRTGGRLDLARAPVKLLAIVNRIDLAGNASYGHIGGAELRFIFEVMNPASPTCAPLVDGNDAPTHLMFAYGVPRAGCDSLHDWALRWKTLEAMTPGSPGYNAALEAMTEEVVRRGAAPDRPHGSALNQLRTNDRGDDAHWVLEEFHLTNEGLRHAGVRQTPDGSFNGARGGARQADLAAWINGRPASILAGTYTVGDLLGTIPFLGASATNGEAHGIGPRSPSARATSSLGLWRAAGIASPALRHAFSLGTCDGCHGEETNTSFVHVGQSLGGIPFGTRAPLSGFLTGETFADPDQPGLSYRVADLERRAGLLQDWAETDCFDTVDLAAIHRLPHVFLFPLPPLAIMPVLAAD